MDKKYEMINLNETKSAHVNFTNKIENRGSTPTMGSEKVKTESMSWRSTKEEWTSLWEETPVLVHNKLIR